ncbi:MAG: hypothetical protein QF609_09025, partial [Gammaproteobacteria bacterium]|nr:hypothetical protein [Gammaproteobacteria bacterium]
MNRSAAKPTRRRLLVALGASLAVVACESTERSATVRATTEAATSSPSPDDSRRVAFSSRDGGLRPSFSEAEQTPNLRRRERSVFPSDIIPD